MGKRLALVHLVWGPLGPAPLDAFLAAYRARAPGAAHDLVILFNGVEHGARGAAAREPLLRALEGTEHTLLELDRPVLDLAAYFQAAARLEHDRVCFLNSYSEPLVDGWLARLEDAATGTGAAMVGATCSWASHSSHVRYLLGLGGAYAAAYGARDATKEVFAPSGPPDVLADGPPAGQPTRRGRRSPAEVVRAGVLLTRQLTQFPAFPDPHLRTNGFLVERRMMLRIAAGRLRDKTDTYALESGRRSLTRQVLRAGGRVMAVGSDGHAYSPEDWPRSRTFWQSSQENLLIADNQTRSYERGDMDVRRMLSAHAWGDRADPSPPGSQGRDGAAVSHGNDGSARLRATGG